MAGCGNIWIKLTKKVAGARKLFGYILVIGIFLELMIIASEEIFFETGEFTREQSGANLIDKMDYEVFVMDTGEYFASDFIGFK